MAATLARMVEILHNPERAEAFARLARPAPLAGGLAPEERLIVCGIGWEGHLALDEAMGHDRPGPRFYYLDGDLEIMSTSEEHERIKKWIGTCMDIFFEEHEIWNMPRGYLASRSSVSAPCEEYHFLEILDRLGSLSYIGSQPMA